MVTSEVKTQTLRERIAEVNAANVRVKAEDEAKLAQRRRKDLIDQLRERLGVEVSESAITMRDPGTPVVEVEGFCFTLGSPSDFDGDLALISTCGACRKEYRRAIWSISGIADPFVPYPHTNNYCLQQEQSPESLTTELRLLQALRDFIAENSYRPEG
jgi:hypothetical protein